ncbi:hypothetical protein TPA0909_42280 [Streptomyces albus]|nr:hypothetical protein TPA0909_42280 [Streptomyces albus]
MPNRVCQRPDDTVMALINKELKGDKTFQRKPFEFPRVSSHTSSHSMPCVYSFAPEYA